MPLSRILCATALAALFAAPHAAGAQAVPPPAVPLPPAAAPEHPHHGHHGRFMRALHSLDLTAQQRAQIDGFVRQTREANQNADPATRKANGQKLRANIESVLTPEQHTQLQAQLRRQHPPQPAPSAPSAPGG